MQQELCVFPRVDSAVFSRVARQHGMCLFAFDSTSAGAGAKPDQETLALFDALDPLYSTALKSFGSKLPELDGLGLGRGLDAKWNICGVRNSHLHTCVYNAMLLGS